MPSNEELDNELYAIINRAPNKGLGDVIGRVHICLPDVNGITYKFEYSERMQSATIVVCEERLSIVDIIMKRVRKKIDKLKEEKKEKGCVVGHL